MKNLKLAMSSTLILTAIATGSASSAWGFVRVGQKSYVGVSQAMARAQKEGLGISYRERALKTELEQMRKTKPQKFKDLVEEKVTIEPDRQGQAFEVRDGTAKIEKAKILAKLTILDAVKSNWTDIEKSVLNSYTVKSWNEFSYYFKRDLNEDITYHPSKRADSKDFTFSTGDWGRVVVASNMKSSRYVLDISSNLDGNKLEPGAADIQILEGPSFEPLPTPMDKGPESPQEKPAPPIAAPIMAGQEKKSLAPQLRKTLNK